MNLLMNLLLDWYPGDSAVWFVARLFAEVAVVVAAAGFASWIALRRKAAARQALWLAVLVTVAAALFVALCIEQAGWTWSIREPAVVSDDLLTSGPPFPAVAARTDLPLLVLPDEARTSSDAVRPAAPDAALAAERPAPALQAPAAPRRSTTDNLRAAATAAALIWIAGAALLCLRTIRGYARMRRIMADVEPIDMAACTKPLAETAEALGISRLPRIALSTGLAGPIMVGILRPTVVLPADFVHTAPTEQLADVLIHECAHALRRDPWIALAQRFVQIAYWPHPLVPLMNSGLCRAREEICDNYVLKRRDPASYAETLLELAQRYHLRPLPAATLAFFSLNWKLEQRVAGLLDPRRTAGTRFGSLKLATLVALLLIASGALAAVRLTATATLTGESLATADEQPAAPAKAKPARETSGAWYLLSQTDANCYLFGLAPRLTRASEPARRGESAWRGVDGGGSVDLEIEVAGGAKGEILVGLFADPRWYLAEPVQVRRFARAGRYSIDRLPPGKFQIGAVVGKRPDAVALGVHKTWPRPIEIAAGKPVAAQLRLSTEFRDVAFGHAPFTPDGMVNQPKVADPDRMITVRTLDRRGDVIPFCRVVVTERRPDNPAKPHFFYDLGTNDRGCTYFDKFNRPQAIFSLHAQRFEIVPETLAGRYCVKDFPAIHDARKEGVFDLVLDDFPVGTGKVRGRVHDQNDKPLTEYFLTLTRRVGNPAANERAAEEYAIHLPVIDADGRFEIGGLAPGTYVMLVRHFDVATHVWTFDGPKAVVPDEPDAEVEVDVEVEAKELRYGWAVFDDGKPVYPGQWIAWIKREPGTMWGGENDNSPTETDGTFRVRLSRAERERFEQNSAGLVEITARDKDNQPIAEAKIAFDKLSTDPEKPTRVVLTRPEPTQQPDAGAPTTGAGATEPEFGAVELTTDQVMSVAVSSDGQFAAGGGFDKNIRIWDPRTAEELFRIEGAQGPIRGLAFQPRGSLLAATDDSGTIRVWDVATGALRQTLAGPREFLRFVDISSDGRVVASCTMRGGQNRQWTGEVLVWDVASGQLIQRLDKQTNGYFMGVAFSPDASLLAGAFQTGDGDRPGSGVKLWDTNTWELKRTLRRDRGASMTVAFSPDGRRIASGGGYRPNGDTGLLLAEAEIREVATGKLVQVLTGTERTGTVSISYSPDGGQIAGQHYAGPVIRNGNGALATSSVTLWNATTGEEIWTVNLPFAPDAAAPAFTPDGRLLITRDAEAVRVLDARTGETVRLLMEVTRSPVPAAIAPAPAR